MRRGPWPRRMSRWCRWPASAGASAARDSSRRTNENTVSRIGTPRITTGISSGAKKKYVLPGEREVGAAADRDRRHREQHAEEQRARVAHDDLRRVPVERQEAEAHADRDDRDERSDVRAVEEAGVEQPVGEQEERAAGDRDDAGGETVETVDEVDRVRHQHDPQRGDERRESGESTTMSVWKRLNGIRK